MKPVIFRQLKPADLMSVYHWAKEIETEDTFITLNTVESISLKEEQQYFKDLFKKIKQKKIVKAVLYKGEYINEILFYKDLA